MKKILPLLLALLLLAGCGPAANTESPAPSPSAASSESPAPAAVEPPLGETEFAIAVPDFLTEDQQTLYRRAFSLYVHLFGCDTSCVEYSETLGTGSFPPRDYETVDLDGYSYLVSQGRYQDWNDFDTVIHAVFTDTYWDSLNNRLDGGLPIFREHGGKLCFLDLGRGAGDYYNGNFPDTFTLNEMTDHAIRFHLVGHYSCNYPVGDETFEERDARVAAGWEYTKAFPVALVLTDDGWRFDAFASASIDEGEYEGDLF